MTDDEIRGYVARGRARCAAFGSMHPGWDLIAEAEALLAGKPTILLRDRIEAALAEMWPATVYLQPDGSAGPDDPCHGAAHKIY